VPDRFIGFEREALSLYLGTPKLTGGAGDLLGRAAALPVDDQHKTRAMMQEILLAIMKCRF
jgi:hypothetical protein